LRTEKTLLSVATADSNYYECLCPQIAITQIFDLAGLRTVDLENLISAIFASIASSNKV